MPGCPMNVKRLDGAWMLTGHQVVREVALDDETYSSATSRFLQVPNGMDGEEHDRFRALTDRYLTHERVRDLEPLFTEIAAHVVSDAIDRGGAADAVGLGAQFAVRASSAWLGWPEAIEAELLDWVRANWEATRSGLFSRTAAVAYDAFGNIAGHMSRSVAMLDERGSGLVFTVLVGRNETMFYTKQIKDGRGLEELSPEEQASISKAIAG